MNKGLYVAVVSVCLAVAHGQQAASVSGDLRKEIKDQVLAASEGRLRANVAHDPDKISSYLADEFVHVDAREAIGKKEYMNRYWYSGDVQPISQILAEPSIFAEGELVFITGVLADKGSYRGHATEAQFRYTQAYRKIGDKWLCVFDQASK